MTPDEQDRIETACMRLQRRYGTLADRQDPKFRELFTPDAAIILPEYAPFVGLETIMDAQADWKASGTLMRHVCTNFTIDVIDAEHATGICYLAVFLGGPQPADARNVAPTIPISLGEFHDQFVKLDGKWLIKRRVLHRIFRGTAPH